MKKYVFYRGLKFFLITLVTCMIIFCLIGDYYHSENDIFIEGDIFFNYSTMERDVTITATDEEEKLIRKWLTTLSSDDQSLHPVMGFPDIVIKGEESSVGFIPGIEKTYIYPEIGGRWRTGYALQMYIAYSSDPELTQQVIDLCGKVRENEISKQHKKDRPYGRSFRFYITF